LIYTSYTVEGNTIQPEKGISTYSKIGNTAIALNNLFRYTYSINKQSYYINAGVSFAFSISEINEKEKTYLKYTNTPTVKGLAVEYPKKIEAGLLIGVGARYDKLSIEVRYMRGNGMTPYNSVNLGSITDKLYFLLSYQL